MCDQLKLFCFGCGQKQLAGAVDRHFSKRALRSLVRFSNRRINILKIL